MLILSRKKGQRVVIGDVVLTVLRVQGRQVGLGIEAPPNVVVRREELSPRAAPVRPDERVTRN
jgi:carbon storage regulator